MRIRSLRQRKSRGQGLVEYGLIIAGVSLVCAAAVSEFGHKTSDLWAAVAVILPGAHSNDNGPMISGHLIDVTMGSNIAGSSGLVLDLTNIVSETGGMLGENTLGLTANGGDSFGGAVLETR